MPHTVSLALAHVRGSRQVVGEICTHEASLHTQAVRLAAGRVLLTHAEAMQSRVSLSYVYTLG